MNKITGVNTAQSVPPRGVNRNSPESRKQETTVQQAFQDFVAGTFYKQMFKSLRKMHGKPAYFHGGAAEEMFQSQLDQQVAEDLAREQGSRFADPLFSVFAQKVRIRPAESPQVKDASGSAASNRG